MASLREILTGFNADELQVLLKLAGGTCAGVKSVVVDRLVKDVYGQNLKKTWDLLLPIEKLAVAEAIYVVYWVVNTLAFRRGLQYYVWK